MALTSLPPSDYHDLHDEAARVAYLIAGFLKDTLTPEEHRELDRWVEQSDRNMRLFEELTEEVRRSETLHWARSLQGAGSPYPPLPAGTPHRQLRTFLLPAAACLLLLASAWWVVLRPRGEASSSAERLAATTLPGPFRATLTLKGSRTAIPLTGNDTTIQLPRGGPLTVRDEALQYPKGPAASGPEHGLHTPAGSTFRVVLPDSTRVWLSASSTLRFPAAFTGGERRVELQGEAYFEVYPDGSRPFRVHTGGVELRVLGTAFNVEAYGSAVATTLVEGRLRVEGNGGAAELVPGEQLRCPPGGPWQKIRRADVAAALDWQSGVFLFRETPLGDVLRELGQWYDKEDVFEGPGTVHLTATIPRHLALARVLSILEATGTVRFRVEGRTLRGEALR